jgi:xanthine/CO dehydrogenase XdhC/CoxF family maturation factor
VGAVMAVDAAGRRTGTLSSGCVENDIALHAQEALEAGAKITQSETGRKVVDTAEQVFDKAEEMAARYKQMLLEQAEENEPMGVTLDLD